MRWHRPSLSATPRKKSGGARKQRARARARIHVPVVERFQATIEAASQLLLFVARVAHNNVLVRCTLSCLRVIISTRNKATHSRHVASLPTLPLIYRADRTPLHERTFRFLRLVSLCRLVALRVRARRGEKRIVRDARERY